MNNKLDVCKQTRKIASDALYRVLKKLMNSHKPISEVKLRDAWLSEMRKNKNVFADGWYIPPPHGMGVLFATEDNFERINFLSIRPEEFWPRDDVFLNKEKGIVLLYSSPVDKKTGIIGDFEITLYFGKNKIIRNQLKTNLEIIYKVFEYTKRGMKLSDIYKYGNKLLTQNNLVNTVSSITDPTGANIGHTIPFSYEEMTSEEKKVLKFGSKKWEKAYALISKKRKFVNASELLKFEPTMAITVEPRSKIRNKKESPLISFHAIILIKQYGEKELLTDFNDIFKLVGMNYMLE